MSIPNTSRFNCREYSLISFIQINLETFDGSTFLVRYIIAVYVNLQSIICLGGGGGIFLGMFA